MRRRGFSISYHDLCFEYLALDFGIPISYGDVGEMMFPVAISTSDG